MKIDKEMSNDILILNLKGRLDAATAPRVKQVVAEAGGTNRLMVLEMTGVEFLDSSGLGALISSARSLRENGGDLKLAGLSPKVRYVFDLTKTIRLFDMFDNTAAAVESFKDE